MEELDSVEEFKQVCSPNKGRTLTEKIGPITILVVWSLVTISVSFTGVPQNPIFLAAYTFLTAGGAWVLRGLGVELKNLKGD